MSTSAGTDYLQTAITRLRYYKDLGERALGQLRDEDFHYQPNAVSNSIAVIIKHMHGNMLSRWTNFLTEDGEKEWRNRDDEFTEEALSAKDLMLRWEEGWACFLDSLQSLREDDLVKTVHIRQEGLTVVDAINRQLAHYSYHIGQIVYVARMILKESWKNLSIPPGKSVAYNQSSGVKDPARNFK